MGFIVYPIMDIASDIPGMINAKIKHPTVIDNVTFKFYFEDIF